MNKRTGDYQTLNKIGEGVLTKAHIHYIWDPQNWYVHQVKKWRLSKPHAHQLMRKTYAKFKKRINCKRDWAHKVHNGGRSGRQTGGQTHFNCLLLLLCRETAMLAKTWQAIIIWFEPLVPSNNLGNPTSCHFLQTMKTQMKCRTAVFGISSKRAKVRNRYNLKAPHQSLVGVGWFCQNLVRHLKKEGIF